MAESDGGITVGSLRIVRLSEVTEARGRGRDTVKVTVNLPRETVAALRVIAAERGVTVTEAMRQAIEAERFLHDETKRGGKVFVEQPSGATTRIVFR